MPINNIILITGPTASGKSKLAVDLALLLKGEVINLDSVQLYKGCNIGSAKISKKEMKGIKHHLIDVLSPNQQSSVGWYIKEADNIIDQIIASAKTPIFCGGTTLYLTALLHGLMPASNVKDNNEYEQYSTEDLYRQLVDLDIEASKKIHFNDRIRIIRALEIIKEMQVSWSSMVNSHGFKQTKHNALVIILLQKRDILYKSISNRVDLMLSKGLIQEVESLIAQFGENIPPLKAVGYKEVVKYLAGYIPTKDILSEKISVNTRNLAKRQMTYFRNEPQKRGWHFFNIPQETINIGGEASLTSHKGRKLKSFSAYYLNKSSIYKLCRDFLSQSPKGIFYCYVTI